MRTIFRAIISIGIIESFLIGFILVNILAFLLCITKKRTRLTNGALVFITLACGGIGTAIGMWVTRRKRHVSPWLAVIGMIIVLIPTVHLVHGLTFDRQVRFYEIEFVSKNWPAELNGYRIAFMTDMHIIPHGDMRAVIEELNTLSIDLLLVGGDFSTRDNHFLGTVWEIAQATTTDGIFGVEGNHDDFVRLFAAYEQHGITPLDNNGLHIHEGFFLAGVRDLWHGTHDIAAATAGAYDEDFVLLLTHNPDVTMQYPTADVDLIIAGHTHGGQITFFGYAMYLLRGSITDYGTRFSRGFSTSADGVPVFTSSGIGVYYTTPRIWARPEVIIFTLRRDMDI